MPDQDAKFRERKPAFTTLGGIPLPRVATRADLPEAFAAATDLGQPGEPPFTRGIHPTMYRGRRWTMRQFSGFGSAAETNRRFHLLLQQGQTGLSVAFDVPTLMGRDSDDPLSLGEVGKCGVAVDSLEDMERLLQAIDLEQISVSMTINAPAAAIWAMYLVVAERRGMDWRRLSGTLQNDILKEYIAQKEFRYPPAPALRLVTDTIAFASEHLPRYHPISISGYHIREAGATALQELAFTLRDGVEYVEWALRRGLDIDAFAPRLSFFFNAHSDFFEEIAKYRAARKLWSTLMRERFGARDPKSWKLRFHAQTAGVSLTAQQPYNNVTRVALQALSAVLGGAQSLHTNALDEALALPTETAALLALRTQQVLAYETGIADVADPLGGSWLVERLTLELEAGAHAYIEKIDAMGGMIAALDAGFPQREIAESAYRQQQALESGERIQVGVNAFVGDEEPPGVLAIGEEMAAEQLAALRDRRRRRSAGAVESALERLRQAARGRGNLMPLLLDCARAEATVGEISAALETVFGEYCEASVV